MTLVVLAARVLLGAVFAVAVVEKLRDGRAFRRFVAALVGPGWAVRLSIVAVILAESGVAGLLLLPGSGSWSVPAGFGLALALLAAFSVAAGRALRREVRLSCGCLGGSSGPVSRETLHRNAVLALAAGVGLAGSATADAAPLSAGAAAAAGFGLAAAIVVVRFDELRALVRGHA
jgi:methylamine utilization protein MauE